MRVKDLIHELEKYNPDLPVCINDYMGFAEVYEKTIEVAQHKYITFPFTENDEFNYINLKGIDDD